MISNLKPHTTYAIHLRASTASGGKDWVGSVTSQGAIHTYWGKTGMMNQHAAKPGDMNGLLKIINKKMQGKNKYALVDEYTSQQGWNSQIQKTTAAPAAPAAQKKALVIPQIGRASCRERV